MRDVIDKFGKNIPVNIIDENHFETMVEIEPSPPFFGWIFQYGGDILIASPSEVKKMFNNLIVRFDDC